MATVLKLWRRYWALPWKWKGGIAAAVLVVWIAVGAAVDSSEPDESPPADPATEASPTAAPTNNSTATATPIRPTATPAGPTATRIPPTATQPPTATPTRTPPEYVPGLTAADVTKNLESKGFKCSGPNRGQTMESWSCTSTDPDADIYVSMLGASATRIRSVSGSVIVTAAGQPDSVAADFLGYLATLPYNGADPARAREWVESNISAGGQLIIGDARFTLSGPKGGRSLDIVAAGAK